MSFLDLKVPEDTKEIARLLTDVRRLIKDVVLEELTKHDEEIKKLRKATWPVCQCIKENSQITDIPSKIEFLNNLSCHEVQDLVKEKSNISKLGEISLSTTHLGTEELRRLGLN